MSALERNASDCNEHPAVGLIDLLFPRLLALLHEAYHNDTKLNVKLLAQTHANCGFPGSRFSLGGDWSSKLLVVTGPPKLRLPAIDQPQPDLSNLNSIQNCTSPHQHVY